MAISFFTPTAFASVSAQQTSAATAMPLATGTALVVNLGSAPAAVLMASTNAGTVTASTGTVVMPGQSLALAANTYIVALGIGGNAFLNISVGA